jgi:hypothetical protein
MTHDLTDAQLDDEMTKAAIRGEAINSVVSCTEEIERLRLLEKKVHAERVTAAEVLLAAGWSVSRISKEVGLSYSRTYATCSEAPSFVKAQPRPKRKAS